MLLSFSVSNFRSFKDKNTLNMIDMKGTPINIAVFMGANASGKSNFFKAMHISKTFIQLGVSKTDKQLILYDTYLKNNDPVVYEYVFEKDNYYISYSFSIKDNNNSIYNEELQIGDNIDKLNIIYKRDFNGIEVFCKEDDTLCKKVNAMKDYFNDMENPPDTLFLTMMLDRISSNTIQINLIKSFYDNLYTSDINVAVNSNTIINLFPFYLESKILYNEKQKKNFINFLKIADNSIKDIKTIKNNKKELYNTIVHKIDDIEIDIDYSEESGGVRMFAPLFSKINTMLKENKIYIIDELDIRLHYDLISYIVDLINNNNIGSQLIFSCHNIGSLQWNIKNSCFNITEKENGASALLRISDILENEDGKDERIKYYNKGKLGGFPDYSAVETAVNKYKGAL